MNSSRTLKQREKIKQSLIEILVSDNLPRGIEELREKGLLEQWLPELYDCIGFGHKNGKDLYTHLITVAKNVSSKLELRLAALYHDIGKPLTKKVENGKISYHKHAQKGAELLEKRLWVLRFSDEIRQHTTLLVRKHMLNYSPNWSDKAIRRFKAKYGEYWPELYELSMADIRDSSNNPLKGIALYKQLNQRIKNIKPANMVVFKYKEDPVKDYQPKRWTIEKKPEKGWGGITVLYKEGDHIEVKIARIHNHWLTLPDDTISINAEITYEGKKFDSKDELDRFIESNHPECEVIKVNDPNKEFKQAFQENLIYFAHDSYQAHVRLMGRLPQIVSGIIRKKY